MKAYEKAYDIAYEMSSKHGIGSADGWSSLISQARADLDQGLLWGAYIPAGLIVGLITLFIVISRLQAQPIAWSKQLHYRGISSS